MTSVERAFQQLDPLGALIGRPMTYLAAVGIPVYALVTTLVTSRDIDYPLAAVAALAVMVATSVVLVVASSPLRAPFTVHMNALVTGGATAAYLLSAVSTWHSNASLRDDWGPVAVGLTLLSLSQYRPPKEIASAGLVLALFSGVLTLLQAQSFIARTPAIIYALITMAPILTMSLASATFGHFLIDGLVRWRRRAQRAASSFVTENTGWIAQSVQQDRVTILNQEVVPFFSDVLRAGAISKDDKEEARRISDAIRAIMVAEVDRTWLDGIVSQIAGRPADDPHRFATQMSTDQRTAMRATIVALTGHSAFVHESLQLSIRAASHRCRVTLTATLETSDNVLRGELAPYFAVMRIVFNDLKVEFSTTQLRLRFSYEQR